MPIGTKSGTTRPIGFTTGFIEESALPRIASIEGDAFHRVVAAVTGPKSQLVEGGGGGD